MNTDGAHDLVIGETTVTIEKEVIYTIAEQGSWGSAGHYYKVATAKLQCKPNDCGDYSKITYVLIRPMPNPLSGGADGIQAIEFKGERLIAPEEIATSRQVRTIHTYSR